MNPEMMGGARPIAPSTAPWTTSAPETTTFNCPLLQAYVDVFYIYVLGMGPVILTGFFTNIINIVVLRRHFNDINSFLLLQFLAVADLFFLLVCFIYFPVRHLHVLATKGDEIMRRDDWQHAVPILQVVDPLFYLGQTARNWTVILVTFERFISIVHPSFSKRYVTRFRLIGIWVVILIASSIYPIEKFRVMSFKKIVNECSGETDYVISYKPDYKASAHVWRLYYILSIVIIPVILLWIMNILLIFKLRRQIQIKAEHDGVKSQRDREIERQATRMVIGVLTVFTLLETPGCVDRIVAMAGVKYDDTTFHFYQYWRKIALFLNVLHSALNFWAYCASNKAFRGLFLDFLRRKDQPSQKEEGHENLSNSGHSNEVDIEQI